MTREYRDRQCLLCDISAEWDRITGGHATDFESVGAMLKEVNPPRYLLESKGLARLEAILSYLQIWPEA